MPYVPPSPMAVHRFFMVLLSKQPVFPLDLSHSGRVSHLRLLELPGKCLGDCGLDEMMVQLPGSLGTEAPSTSYKGPLCLLGHVQLGLTQWWRAQGCRAIQPHSKVLNLPTECKAKKIFKQISGKRKQMGEKNWLSKEKEAAFQCCLSRESRRKTS